MFVDENMTAMLKPYNLGSAGHLIQSLKLSQEADGECSSSKTRVANGGTDAVQEQEKAVGDMISLK